MEKIDLNNYEAYFLDYMEGALSAEEKGDLSAFLEKYPALKSEIEEDFGSIELFPEAVSFNEKESLKIDENELILKKNTVEDIIVASIEGQLSEKHNQQLKRYIKANNLEKTFAYYNATILKADKTITYSDKSKLKVKTGLVIPMPLIKRVSAIAAVGLVLVTVAMNWNNFGDNPANNTPVTSNFFASDFKGEQLRNVIQKRIESNTENEAIFELNQEDLTLPDYNNEVPNRQINDLVNDIQNDNAIVSNEAPIVLPEEKEDSLIKDPTRIKDAIMEDNSMPDIVYELTKETPIIPMPDLEEEEDFALASVKTEEPYQLVTNAASNLVNRDIKFTRDKDVASNEYRGYHIKLGKFEFERKRSK